MRHTEEAAKKELSDYRISLKSTNYEKMELWKARGILKALTYKIS